MEPRTLDLLQFVKERPTEKPLYICAPMVRYSKQPFRELVRSYGVDIAYTPMMLADVFARSEFARLSDFTTNNKDSPVVVQFAAKDPADLAAAASLVAPYVDGIDLNCGCPQKWAIAEKIGSYLMEKPDIVRDLIRSVKNLPLNKPIPMSIKIRCHPDLKQTVEFVKRAEQAGVDWITIHGRTKKQKSSEPVNMEAIKLAKENATVPVFANGDIFSLSDADEMVALTKVNGVMAARGLLENPALFAGYETTPYECLEKFVDLSLKYGTNSFIFHNHVKFMLDRITSRQEKKSLNYLSSTPAVLDWLDDQYGLRFKAGRTSILT
ncbi:hypothetical protein SmJEL517_g04058 [Synchytrium microbalum]|uniref:tRNA-dihydrouridine synthase n=1 Tax=Synchytrium microbalum TaxID=1806994 RepID=A0A507C5P1_9FUNG|nr:uncharacterized protein SmJEL517_g04058 [Synchytrium microbalum]TPX32863.1 hypothetical protein SmJEL517_g04058 [Synchytrium microbalum]